MHHWEKGTVGVSIQLIAPASGALKPLQMDVTLRGFTPSFHSTDCPSEWGLNIALAFWRSTATGFHSTDCPSEWGQKYKDSKTEQKV